jgi:hypothetical protein
MDNMYTPSFTVPGGASGLTLEQYQSAIWDHDPLIKQCNNKFKWHFASATLISGISGFYLGKRAIRNLNPSSCPLM